MPRSRKARERFFLDRFLGIAGLSPSALTEGESPDFVLELQGRKVGVEVTEIFIEPSAQALSLRTNENMAVPRPRFSANVNRSWGRGADLML